MQKRLKAINQNLLTHSLVLILIWFLFKEALEGLFSSIFISHFLSTIHQSTSTSIIFSLITAYSLLMLVINHAKISIGKVALSLIIFILVIYSYYRFVEHTKFSLLYFFDSPIAFSDLIIVYSVVVIFFHFNKNYNTKPSHKEKGFVLDQPIRDKAEDIMNFAPYAQSLSLKILESLDNTGSALAIGITAKWGHGKTSFINLIKTDISLSNVEIIDFNPWASLNSESIINDFFNTLYFKFKPNRAFLANQILSYSQELLGSRGKGISKSLKLFLEGSKKPNSSHFLFQLINQEIKLNNIKLLVIIDDLDRLDKSELIQVVKLIRNTANFNNTTFLVAYDRNYLNTAITQLNSYNSHLFLEKIFQLEISLPSIDREVLYAQLANRLVARFPNSKEQITAVLLESLTDSTSFKRDHWITNLRDVQRLSNSILLNYSDLEDEVNFEDYFNLELLRVKHPRIHELIFQKRSEYLEIKPQNQTDHTLVLKKQSQYDNDNDKYVISEHIKAKHSEFVVDDSEILKILSLLKEVFGDNLMWRGSKLSPCIPSQFNKYFHYSLLKDELSEVDFANARKNFNDAKLYRTTLQWIDLGKISSLMYKLVNINTFDSRSDFERIIRLIIFSAENDNREDIMYSYDSRDLYNKLCNSMVVKNYYSEDLEEYRNFFFSLFESTPPNGYLINALNRWFYDSLGFDGFIISQTELEDLLTNSFEKFLTTKDKFESDIWSIFHNCHVTLWTKGSNSYQKTEVYLEGAKRAMIEFLKTHNGDQFLSDIIDVNRRTDDHYKLSQLVPEIWGSFEEFFKFLENGITVSKDHLLEFTRFIEVCRENNFNNYVDFRFKTLKQ